MKATNKMLGHDVASFASDFEAKLQANPQWERQLRMIEGPMDVFGLDLVVQKHCDDKEVDSLQFLDRPTMSARPDCFLHMLFYRCRQFRESSPSPSRRN